MMRRPVTLTELVELEVLAHETGLRHDALIIEWNLRKVQNVVQRPPPFIPKVSAATFMRLRSIEIDQLREGREQRHNNPEV